MSNEAHMDRWEALTVGIHADGRIRAFAVVAIDDKGEVFWGADFSHEPERLLNRLSTITSDIKYARKAAERRKSRASTEAPPDASGASRHDDAPVSTGLNRESSMEQ